MPAGKAVALSANLIPSGPSCNDSDGKPTDVAGPVFPTARPICQPTPVVMFTFSGSVILATNSTALEYAESHGEEMDPPRGVGYHGGDCPSEGSLRQNHQPPAARTIQTQTIVDNNNKHHFDRLEEHIEGTRRSFFARLDFDEGDPTSE